VIERFAALPGGADEDCRFTGAWVFRGRRRAGAAGMARSTASSSRPPCH